MPDPTREQAIKACRSAGELGCGEARDAATLLTRDGKLRERLEKLVKDMARDYEAKAWAQDLEAALKEDGK